MAHLAVKRRRRASMCSRVGTASWRPAREKMRAIPPVSRPGSGLLQKLLSPHTPLIVTFTNKRSGRSLIPVFSTMPSHVHGRLWALFRPARTSPGLQSPPALTVCRGYRKAHALPQASTPQA